MKKLITAAAFILAILSASSQSLIESPYSRYGLGELYSNNDAHFFAMSGTGIGFRSPLYINTSNPASYSAFDSLSFMFSGGFIGQYSVQESMGSKAYPFSVSFNSFGFGFRIAPFWGTAFGLQPFSSVGYEMRSTHEMDTTTTYSTVYSGNGGLNKVWWGNAFKLFPGLSIGVNASYIFGTIERERKVVFDSAGYFNTKNTTSRFINDFCFDAGLQYNFIIKRDTGALNNHTTLTIGGVFGMPTSLNASEDYLTQRYYIYGGADYTYDTVQVSTNNKGEVSLPMYYGAGFSVGNKNWSLGADIRMQDWSSYKAYGESDSLQNSMSLSLGGSIIPDSRSISKYYKKITYMGGFHYDKTYLQLRDTQLTKLGISFGMVFPLKPSPGFTRRQSVKIGVEFGKMGTTDMSLISEKYIRFVFGINIDGFWFQQRKYN